MGTNQSVQVLTYAVDVLSQQIYNKLEGTAKGGHGRNVIYSPFQCYLSAFILYLSTEGKTKIELRELIHLSDKTKDSSVQTALLYLLQDVPQTAVTGKSSRMIMRSSHFATREYVDQLQPKFLRVLTSFAGAFEIQFVEFSNALLKCMVDSWSKDRTEGRVASSTGRQRPTPPLFQVDLFVLIDQIDTALARTYSSEMMFRDASNNVCRTTASCLVGRFMYVHDVTYKMRVVRFPLKSHTAYDTLIVLPESRDGLSSSKFRKFMHEQIRTWLDSLTVESEVEIWLPRIRLSSSVEVGELLENAGALSVFTEDADFSGMARLKTTPLYLSSLHANYHLDLSVDVEEQNRREGLVGEINLEDDIYRESARVPFRVDHPFMVLVVHRTTKAVFLVAHVQNVK